MLSDTGVLECFFFLFIYQGFGPALVGRQRTRDEEDPKVAVAGWPRVLLYSLAYTPVVFSGKMDSYYPS